MNEDIERTELDRRRAGTISLPMRIWVGLRDESERSRIPVSRLIAHAIEKAGVLHQESDERRHGS